MDVVPLVDEGLGNSPYVVDLGGGGALVVDPQRDPRPNLAELDRRGLAARFLVETHRHADFVSGGRELAASGALAAWATGAIAEAAGLRPAPFLPGLVSAALGLGLSAVLVRETTGHVAHEAANHTAAPGGHDGALTAPQVFALGPCAIDRCPRPARPAW